MSKKWFVGRLDGMELTHAFNEFDTKTACGRCARCLVFGTVVPIITCMKCQDAVKRGLAKGLWRSVDRVGFPHTDAERRFWLV